MIIEVTVLVLLAGETCGAEVAPDDVIRPTIFMKTGLGSQAILRFCLKDLLGCCVGNTGRMDL